MSTVNFFLDIGHCSSLPGHLVLLTKNLYTMAQQNNTISSLHQLLDYDAQKFTSAEVQLKNSLQEWISKAGSLKLKIVLQKYLDFVQQHIQKLEGFYEAEEIVSLSFTNRVIHAFIEETEEKLSNCSDTEIKDACLLACIQVINHFKISMYGTAAAFANTLGMEEQAAVFHEAEVKEKQIDDRLTQLAEHEINVNAKTTIVLPQQN
jgi:ferritin-like metal-binding protein YciE